MSKGRRGPARPRGRRSSLPGTEGLTIKRVERKIEPRVPEEMSLEELAKLYRLEGIAAGVRIAMSVPDGLLGQLGRRQLATQMPTRSALALFRGGLQEVLRKTEDVAEAHREQVEALAGYVPAAHEEDAIAEEFVRLIAVPEAQGGGWAAEDAAGVRGLGGTREEALLALVRERDGHGAVSDEGA